jgi:hypothetical protein
MHTLCVNIGTYACTCTHILLCVNIVCMHVQGIDRRLVSNIIQTVGKVGQKKSESKSGERVY